MEPSPQFPTPQFPSPGGPGQPGGAPGPAPDPTWQRRQDDEHLKYLSIGFIVWGGLMALVGFLPLVYMLMGGLILVAATGEPDPTGPMVAGAMFIVFAVIIAVLIWAQAVGHFMASRALAQRRWLMLVYVMAGFACMSFPMGTTLGVLTFLVLGRPSVQAQFRNR